MLLISPSRYYDWKNRTPSKRSIENTTLTIRIKEIFDEETSRAGAERIAKRLRFEEWLSE